MHEIGWGPGCTVPKAAERPPAWPQTMMQARLRPSARRLGALARHVAAAQQQPAAGIAYGDYLSATSAAREPSALRSLYPLLQIPGMLSLGNGQPNPDSFPFASLSVTTKDGETFELEGAELDSEQQQPRPFACFRVR